MKKWLLENEKRKAGAVLCIVFVVMYILNILTPMIADDYNYCFSFSSGVRITKLSEIVSSMNGHYYSMNGRIYAHTLAQIFLLMGMGIFDVLNTFAFLALGYCMYRMVLVQGEHRWSLLAVIYTAMFMCIPAFGQTMLWLVGSFNYLWTTLTMLVFLLPYRYYLVHQKPMKKVLIVPFVLLAFLAGACNENTSGGTILCTMLMMAYMFYLKIKWKPWMFMGLIASSLGFLFMITAPANELRSDQISEDSISLMLLKDRFMNATLLLQSQMGKLLLAVVCLFVIAYLYKINKDAMIMAGGFFVVSMACNYAMILSPMYPSRAFVGVEVYMMISGLILFYNLTIDWMILVKRLLIAYLGVQFTFQFLYAFDSILTTFTWYCERESYVEEQIAEGNTNIETFEITSDNRYSIFYNLEDILGDTTSWTNESYSNYHGIDSIFSSEVKQD